MAITATDMKFFYSVSGGEDVDGSLGGAKGTTEVASGDNGLFDDVSGQEANDGDTEYRGIFFENDHATLTLSNTVLWINADATGANDDPAIALCDEGASAAMEIIANENTAPVGPSFTSPATKGAGLSLGNLAAQAYYGFWVRRTVTAAAGAASGSNFTLRVEGDTPA